MNNPCPGQKSLLLLPCLVLALNAAKANHATTVVEKYAKARTTIADRVESNRELFRRADAARGSRGDSR